MAAPKVGGLRTMSVREDDASAGVEIPPPAPALFEGYKQVFQILETMKIEPLPGNRTRLNIQSVYQSVENRDGMIQAGMETGMNQGYEKLDEIL